MYFLKKLTAHAAGDPNKVASQVRVNRVVMRCWLMRPEVDYRVLQTDAEKLVSAGLQISIKPHTSYAIDFHSNGQS